MFDDDDDVESKKYEFSVVKCEVEMSTTKNDK